MKLPKLLLDADIATCLQLLEQAQSASTAFPLDASEVIKIEPVGACLVANAARRAFVAGKPLVIDRMPERLRKVFERMKCPIVWGIESATTNTALSVPQVPTLALQVSSASDANSAANTLSEHIASFVPQDLRTALLHDEYGQRIYHAVQPALAHVLSELLDNVFSHAANQEYIDPIAWVAAQYYPNGDLMRVAVVDDGCGLLGSLRGVPELAPRNHFDAALAAFTPFVSSKNRPTIYTDRRHMGIGLPVCRDLCQKLKGRIYSVSGNAQLINAGIEGREERKQVRYFQGTIISLEFHRQAASNRTLRDALDTYAKIPSVDVRFK